VNKVSRLARHIIDVRVTKVGREKLQFSHRQTAANFRQRTLWVL